MKSSDHAGPDITHAIDVANHLVTTDDGAHARRRTREDQVTGLQFEQP